MTLVLLALVLSTAPSVIRVDMQDALQLPGGFVTPPADPMIIYVRAPASWVAKGAITDTGKSAVLARLYGSPDWMNGNSDGSTYVVKAFKSRVLGASEKPDDGPRTYWYEVKADGALDPRGKDFGPRDAPKAPESLIGSAEKGSVFKQGPSVTDAKAMLDWLGKQKGLVKLPVVLKKAQVGFGGRDAKVGPTTILVDDTALGVSLADRAHDACADQPTCEMWLIGNWKGKTGKDLVFSVVKAEGAIGAGERDMKMNAHVWYQAE